MARRWTMELWVMVAVGLVLGLAGPFDTFQIPFGQRIGYWLLMMVAGWAIIRPIGLIADRMAAATGLAPSMMRLMASLIGAFPLSLLVARLFIANSFAAVLHAPALPLIYAEVAGVALAIQLLNHLLFRDAKADQVRAAPHSSPNDLSLDDGADLVSAQISGPQPSTIRDRLSDRLPPGFGPVLALKSEDHYVRVYGGAREELLLMRLRDAVAMLPPATGVQVHRSWWVAHHAVKSASRDGRGAILILTNDITVPVARDNMAAVRDAGWIK